MICKILELKNIKMAFHDVYESYLTDYEKLFRTGVYDQEEYTKRGRIFYDTYELLFDQFNIYSEYVKFANDDTFYMYVLNELAKRLCTSIHDVFDREKYHENKKKRKREDFGSDIELKRYKKGSIIDNIPNEIWFMIIKFLPLLKAKGGRRPRCIITCKSFYIEYMKLYEEKFSLDPKKHVFYMFNRNRPEFFEFTGVTSKGYIKFMIGEGKKKKVVRRLKKCDEDELKVYCTNPLEGHSLVYRIDISEKDRIGKKTCEGCNQFTYCCISNSGWFSCGFHKCLIEKEEYEEIQDNGLTAGVTAYERHQHILCDICYPRK
ncbi:MAG TPA: hypothetical protein VIY08_00665 [Candidatus Nitrosocosmicus sp.]